MRYNNFIEKIDTSYSTKQQLIELSMLLDSLTPKQKKKFEQSELSDKLMRELKCLNDILRM